VTDVWTEEDGPKTVSIWWFVLVFVLAGSIGLYWFLTHGNPHAPTEQLNPPTTTTALAAEPEATTPIPTMPDGTKAPSDISAVLSQDGTVSYSFNIPDELARVPVRATVGRAVVEQNPDANGLSVRVDCTAGAGEDVAQITVSESTDTVTVLPIVLTPQDAPACQQGLQIERIVLPLTTPLGTRDIVVAPPGTEVPDPRSG